MRTGRIRGAALAAALVCGAPSGWSDDAEGTRWSADAVRDLVAAHDIIRDDDPGPVDPLDPGFRDRLDRGEALLLPRARNARTRHDYRDVLRAYTNGFADVHVFVRFDRPEPELWPGFLTRTLRIDGPTAVVLVDDAAGVAVGDTLVACGGVPVGDLLASGVERTLTNPALPQLLRLTSPYLTVVDADDARGRFARCRLRDRDGRVRDVPVTWRPIDAAALGADVARASGIDVPPLGIRRIGDVWLVSLPSFTWNGREAARMRAAVASLRAAAPSLHAADRVVLDLRGNEGGSTTWGDDVASALWGDDAVKAAEATMDWTVDWRVSRRNRDTLKADASDARQAEHGDEANDIDALVGRMDRALAARSVLLRNPAPATGSAPHLASPFSHEVFVLTEPHCRSACLDFLDLLARLPGNERIGLPTAADTDDMDDTLVRLPSGRATIAVPMKVFRDRKRGADIAYRPLFGWPGGIMTDATVAHFADTLPH